MFVGKNTNDVVKIHRSEQLQLPSVSSEARHDSPSVCQSETNDDEIALATYKNKQHLRELGGEIKTSALKKVLFLLKTLHLFVLSQKDVFFVVSNNYCPSRVLAQTAKTRGGILEVPAY